MILSALWPEEVGSSVGTGKDGIEVTYSDPIEPLKASNQFH